MKSRRVLFTSSECVQPMLCGPPSTATSVQSTISAGSRAAVASNGRIRSSVPWTTRTGTSILETSARKSVSQVSTQAWVQMGTPTATLKLRLPGAIADPAAAENIDVVKVLKVLEVRIAVMTIAALMPRTLPSTPSGLSAVLRTNGGMVTTTPPCARASSRRYRVPNGRQCASKPTAPSGEVEVLSSARAGRRRRCRSRSRRSLARATEPAIVRDDAMAARGACALTLPRVPVRRVAVDQPRQPAP